MLSPSKIAPELEQHEEVFLARYTRLRAWALRITENDTERAEDLVHDLYIQFTLTRPALGAIGNLDAYLYTMLRNLHLSQLRRSLRMKNRSLSIVDYDSAETGLLRAADPRERMRLQDELRQVCRYACARKETSKAGSVLVLRFFHGYYPREIALVMRATRQAVEERLRFARSEARQYLENPNGLRFMRDTAHEALKPDEGLYALTADEFLSRLRGTVFDSRRAECLPPQRLEKLYAKEDASGIDHATLAHFASCPRCLDEINRMLGLPLLHERFPWDSLGSDTRPKGGGGSGGDEGDGGGAAGGPSEGELHRCRKRARDVFEHRPAELCVSVNGYPLGAQKVGSELNEQTLSINVPEKIDFVEIFSEQDVRLLFVTVDDAALSGARSRQARVELSDGRTLEATLGFSEPWPTLQVVYSDPTLHAEAAAATQQTTAAPRKLAPVSIEQAAAQDSAKHSEPSPSQGLLARLLRRFGNTGFWLRPSTITATVALLLVAALLLTRVHTPAASAAELLRRSKAAEEVAAANAGAVRHRTINMEERKAESRELLSRRRIEVWQSAAHGVKLRRIFDDQGTLVAGEWTKTDGTSIVYRRGAEPQARTAPALAAGAVLETGELWRLDASAEDFAALVGTGKPLTVEERDGAYVLSYRGTESGDGGRLLRANLTLKGNELRAVEQTLVVSLGGESHEFSFVEAGFEERPAGSVPPETFRPEPELTGPAARVNGEGAKGVATKDPLQPNTTVTAPTEQAASPELEIEVTYLLNQIKANLGEQVSMTRTTGGTLRVEALAETEGRKEEILRALGPILKNPAVRVEVSTVAEALRRQQQQQRGRTGPRGETNVREVEIADDRIPADAELRAYYSARLVGDEAVNAEINRFASRAMNRSRQALLRASALKSLAARFTPEQIQALSPEARAKWLGMVREHALAYRREVSMLMQELRAVFAGSGGAAPGEVVTESNLAQAAGRLLQLSYNTDEAVRSAFTVSADGRTAAAIKSSQFWRSLSSAEKLAGAIADAYRN